LIWNVVFMGSQRSSVFAKTWSFWFKLPVWIAALPTGAKSFCDNPIIGHPGLNAWGLHAYRVQLAAQMTAKRRAKLAAALDEQDRVKFEQNGFILKENFLPQAQFDALKAEIMSHQILSRETLQGDTVTRRMSLDDAQLKQLPQTAQVLRHPLWRAAINYVGSFRLHPMSYVQVILSQVKQARPDPQTHLHSDTFHSSVKAWLFLTDVAEDEGPFVYVAGSHRLTPQRLAWEKQRSIQATDLDRMSARGSLRIDPSALAGLGYGQPKAFAVPANTLVVADTYGFHARGPSARPSIRIELWAFARRNPFLPWVGFDPSGVPWMRGRLVSSYWWAMDMAEKLQIKKNPWRAVGQIYPDAKPIVLSKSV
jgi:hypothetical protein